MFNFVDSVIIMGSLYLITNNKNTMNYLILLLILLIISGFGNCTNTIRRSAFESFGLQKNIIVKDNEELITPSWLKKEIQEIKKKK